MIFFDLDDTLLQHSEADEEASLSFYARHALDLEMDVRGFQLRWRELHAGAAGAFAAGGVDPLEQRRWSMRELFGREFSDEEADEIYQGYLDRYQRCWRLFDDVMPCLKLLSEEQAVGIISNGCEETELLKLRTMGIADRVLSLTVPAPQLRGKPFADIFKYAAASMGVEPRECVYVGDQLFQDAVAARNAGLRGIWLDRSRSRSQVRNVEVVHDLYELPAQLLQLRPVQIPGL